MGGVVGTAGHCRKEQVAAVCVGEVDVQPGRLGI